MHNFRKIAALVVGVGLFVVPHGLLYASTPGSLEGIGGEGEMPLPPSDSVVTTPTTESPTPVPPRGTAVFQPLANLPGLVDTNRTLPQYVNVLFRLAIGIGALIGVVKIIIAGIKYMGTDAYSSKEEAKGDIRNVLVGLLIMLSTWVILTTIYPGIVNLNILNLGKLGAPAPTVRPTASIPDPMRINLQEGQRIEGQVTIPNAVNGTDQAQATLEQLQQTCQGNIIQQATNDYQGYRYTCIVGGTPPGGGTLRVSDPARQQQTTDIVAGCTGEFCLPDDAPVPEPDEVPPAQPEQNAITGPLMTAVSLTPYMQTRMAQSGQDAFFVANPNQDAPLSDQLNTTRSCCEAFGGTLGVQRDIDYGYDVMVCSAPRSAGGPRDAGPTCSQLSASD